MSYGIDPTIPMSIKQYKSKSNFSSKIKSGPTKLWCQSPVHWKTACQGNKLFNLNSN